MTGPSVWGWRSPTETIFALTPGLVIVMALAGLLLGPGAETQIIEQIHDLIGAQSRQARGSERAPSGALADQPMGCALARRARRT
jgi:hypothetical protein